MRYRFLILSIVAAVVTALACNSEEKRFECSLLSTEVENIGENSARLVATINASDYAAIDQMGFMVAVGETLMVFDYWRGENGEIRESAALSENDFKGFEW